MNVCSPHWLKYAALLVAAPILWPGPVAAAPDAAVAEVVVIVDTSTSMREEGMDPERTSLLVTKLFTDIVPGRLGVVRLLDLVADRDVLPSRETGEKFPCDENPKEICSRVEPASDWGADARAKKLGALERPERGDARFKKDLESHLAQRANNSLFGLAFRAAEGIFDGLGPTFEEAPRTVLWLSDGRTHDESGTHQAIRELAEKGISVEAIVFGKGSTSFAEQAGIEVEQVSGPAALMKAFAGAFRRMVRAPYELDARIADQKSFPMLPELAEAWVVVYGDPSLGTVRLGAPSGQEVEATFAGEVWPTAGAYRVAYLTQPEAGNWSIRVEGGGPEVAFAVVQFSSLAPVLLSPSAASIGVETRLVVGVQAGGQKQIRDKTLLANARVTSEVAGRTVSFQSNEDGTFTAPFTFEKSGKIPLVLHLESPTVDRKTRAKLEVYGSFWERWGWLILTLLGSLLAAFIIAGFVLPHRFPRAFALVFVPERDELDQQQPQPLGQWKGVRIGFYRSARAYLHSSFRISGESRGALALLMAERGGARAFAGKGPGLWRETLDSGWEQIPAEGCRVRSGDVFRCGDAGPFFRAAARGGQS